MLKDILGVATIQEFLTQAFFAFVGVVISLLIHGATKYKEAVGTPVKFSLWFLLKDNAKRILLNILLIYATLRFFPDITGIDITFFWCLIIGLCYDRLAQLLKSKTDILDVQRKADPDK
ncbi:hypothetical protein [Arachidicoccus terrestris]|uniref:hypothetical protein n=1 Tax=Arachidicoccus terrestris TaxID=2875539 RepID=UPI001CC74B5D|nr:hypothetical protein [Arachidicoccus terrestris]UAY56277.1 hypothetical protein K9M52_04465 [Arachidicoccus terrestris]